MADRPRILVLGEAGLAASEWLRGWPDAETVRADSLARALDMLAEERFDAVVANPADKTVLENARRFLQSQRILAAVPDGLALVDFDLKIRWANPTFQAWCGGNPVGRGFYDALGSPEMLGPEYCPFHTALASRDARREADSSTAPEAVTACLVCRNNRFIELHVTPLDDPGAAGPMLFALARDVTHTVEQRQKLDALHEAGRTLAALAPEQLAEMSVAERIELLKVNIRRFTRDLLHYDVIEIRVLDRQTGRLEPLLARRHDARGRPPRPRTVHRGQRRHRLRRRHRQELSLSRHAPGPALPARAPRGAQLADGAADLPGPGDRHVQRRKPRGRTTSTRTTCNSPRFSATRSPPPCTRWICCRPRKARRPRSRSRPSTARWPCRWTRSWRPPRRCWSATSAIEPDIADKLRKILAAARSIKQSIQKVGEDLAPTRPPTAGPQPPKPASLKGLRVLVADDDERVRRAAHGLLGRWGCVVETARDGRRR